MRVYNALISTDEHAQTSVSEHGDRHSPRPAGAQTAQKQHAGLLKRDAQPSAARIGVPEGAARKASRSDPGFGICAALPLACRLASDEIRLLR